ncbi:MAG: hypothetical protein ABI645_04370 [Pseudomonadota bacterium]
MNSMFSRSGFLAAALALTALAGCNAVEDVRSEPFIDLPSATVVIQGTVTGLGSKRSLGLTNNGLNSDALSVTAPVPLPTDIGVFPTVFSFGSRDVQGANGSPVPYDIEIKTQPYGKTCAFRAGSVHSGVLSTASPPDIVIDCIPTAGLALYDVTVNLDSTFANSPGATVQLTTEEGVYVQAVTQANINSLTLKFDDKLFNGNGAGAPSNSPVFTWNVSASTTFGGTVNKCPIVNPTNSPATANPTADISGASAPKVNPCTYTIAGKAYYSRPAGVTADTNLGTGGMTLELRNLNGVKKGTATVAAGAFPANGIDFTFNNLDSPATTAFTNNPDADFQVVVTSQPQGQTCIVPDGGYVSLRSLVNLNPVNVTGTGVTSAGATIAAGPVLAPVGTAASANIPVSGTRLVIACRNKPASAANTLNGVYRLTQTVATMLQSTGTTLLFSTSSRTVTSTWKPFDLTVQNTASSNVIAFFDDGTFLYGAHLSSVGVEHGFYDYSPTLKADDSAPGSSTPAGRLRLTLHTDTHFNTVFPATFNSLDALGNTFEVTSFTVTNILTTAGSSALPGALTYTTAPNAPLPFRHVNLGNVVKTVAVGAVPAKITGTAGPYGGNAANINTAVFTPVAITYATPPAAATATTVTSVAAQVDWELTEVRSLNGEMTGGWITQDHRRIWVWDKASTFGNHVGVNGLTNIESACFVVENPSGNSGNFQRRSGQTGCYPINRPRLLPTPQTYTSIGMEAQDVGYLLTTHNSSTTAGAPGAPTGAFATGNVSSGTYSTANLAARFPNYEARIPGGQSALDGRYVSPVYYFVAPAATFSTLAPALYFPAPAAPFSSWCTTEILGLRATVNDVPFREVVYFCRTRAQ